MHDKTGFRQRAAFYFVFPSLLLLHSHWLLLFSGVADAFLMFSTLDIWETLGTQASLSSLRL